MVRAGISIRRVTRRLDSELSLTAASASSAAEMSDSRTFRSLSAADCSSSADATLAPYVHGLVRIGMILRRGGGH